MTESFSLSETLEELKTVLKEVDLTEIEYQQGDIRLKLVRKKHILPKGSSRRVQDMSVEEPSKVVGVVPDDTSSFVVVAPMVGTVYLAPEPGAKPFVRAGDSVKKGQTLLIVETMKVMNPVRADRDGVVKDVKVADARPVEFGEPLIILEVA